MNEAVLSFLGGGAAVALIKLLEVVVNRWSQIREKRDEAAIEIQKMQTVSDLALREETERREDELSDRYMQLLSTSLAKHEAELNGWKMAYQAKIDEQIASMSREVESARNQAERYQGMYIRMLEQNTQQSTTIISLQGTISELESRIAHMEHERASEQAATAREINGLRARIDTLEQEKVSLQEELRQFKNGGNH